MMITGGNYTVYLHHFPNDKWYVGITERTVEKRWDHGRGYPVANPIGRAIQKYGWDNIEHIIFASHLNQSEAENMERLLIQKMHTLIHENGYNVEAGGIHGKRPLDDGKIIELWEYGLSLSRISKITHHDTATIKKALMHSGYTPQDFQSRVSMYLRKVDGISEASKSYTTRIVDVSGLWNDGNSVSEIAKSLNIDRGTVRSILVKNGISKEDIQARSKSREKIRLSICNPVARPVDQFSINGTLLCTYPTAAEASRATNVLKTSIWAACNGRYRTAGGFVWKYAEN